MNLSVKNVGNVGKKEVFYGTNLLRDLAVRIIQTAPAGDFKLGYNDQVAQEALRYCFAKENRYKSKAGSETILGYMSRYCVNAGLFERVKDNTYRLTPTASDLQKRLSQSDEQASRQVHLLIKSLEDQNRHDRKKKQRQEKQDRQNKALLSPISFASAPAATTPSPAPQPVASPAVQQQASRKICVRLPISSGGYSEIELPNTPEIRRDIMALLGL